MSEGISFSGPGGVTPGKSEISKSLSEIGPAKDSDLTQFEHAFKGQEMPQDAKISINITESAGPFDLQATRITDSGITAQPNLGEKVIDYFKQLSAVSTDQTEKINATLEGIKETGEFTQIQAIELQMHVTDMALFTEAISKGSRLFVTAVQTGVKQQ